MDRRICTLFLVLAATPATMFAQSVGGQQTKLICVTDQVAGIQDGRAQGLNPEPSLERFFLTHTAATITGAALPGEGPALVERPKLTSSAFVEPYHFVGFNAAGPYLYLYQEEGGSHRLEAPDAGLPFVSGLDMEAAGGPVPRPGLSPMGIYSPGGMSAFELGFDVQAYELGSGGAIPNTFVWTLIGTRIQYIIRGRCEEIPG